MINKDDDHDGAWTASFVLKHVIALLNANDQRYQERFAAQEKAVKDALASQEKAVNAALAAAEKAVLVAETNASEWRKGANEWRQAMTDRESKFVANKEYDLLKERVDKTEGGSKGQRDMWGWAVAGVMLMVVVANFFILNFKGVP